MSLISHGPLHYLEVGQISSGQCRERERERERERKRESQSRQTLSHEALGLLGVTKNGYSR